MTSVGANGVAPFQTVLTHGFIVDDQGRKMSKSLGNVMSAVKLTETYGADVMRLYVASLDYANDIRMSERGIKETSEAYRKVRNTFRFLLGNLEDYAPFSSAAELAIDPTELQPLDRWILARLNKLVRDVTEAYERFEFYRVFHAIHQFASVDLSSLYLDVLKDRLYAEQKAGPSRRAAQKVMARIHSALVRLSAPLMPHTSDEVWGFLPEFLKDQPSVHLADWPTVATEFELDETGQADWEKILALREEMLRELEKLRAAKRIGSAQEATVTLVTQNGELREWLARNLQLLQLLTSTSSVDLAGESPVEAPTVSASFAELTLSAAASGHAKCERCWNLRSSVGQNSTCPTLCDRCAAVVLADHKELGGVL